MSTNPVYTAATRTLSPALPAAGSSTNTSNGVLGSTAAASGEGTGCDLVFCTRTSCEVVHGGGSVDCYCCEPEYPNAPCFRTKGACLAKCPLCNSPSPRRSPYVALPLHDRR
ncbi:hypothetical protein GQ55_4G308800 [Panicum hallii var. hallii]|uniref:Uncharacterized protein n=1 Tax=Panicum hallii var. hallii TaxID=1504633 RepID=A0A2T7E215_9POAL|nr:hypothetical protein GQ55_4G308800 [Panicum hallii var. hallii]